MPSRSPASWTGPAQALDRAAAQATDLGLLAEQVDPETGELLGNFPQAFSHIGLINAAGALATALEGSRAGAVRATVASRWPVGAGEARLGSAGTTSPATGWPG